MDMWGHVNVGLRAKSFHFFIRQASRRFCIPLLIFLLSTLLTFFFRALIGLFFLFFRYGSIAPASASIDAHSHNIDFAALVESQSEPVQTAPLPPKWVNEPEAKVTSSIEEALMVGGEYEIKEALNLGGEDAINPRI